MKLYLIWLVIASVSKGDSPLSMKYNKQPYENKSHRSSYSSVCIDVKLVFNTKNELTAWINYFWRFIISHADIIVKLARSGRH